MQDSIQIAIKNFDWKSQTVGGVCVPDLLAKIGSGFYRSKPVEIDLQCIDLGSYNLGIADLRDAVVHFSLVQKSNLRYPVIVDHKGVIIDGRHRLCKAIMLGHTSIKGIMLLDNVYPSAT